MKTFVYHENASGKASFTRTGDSYYFDEENLAFAVADSPLRCLIRDTKNYPMDDFGFNAADTFCREFVKYASVKRKRSFKRNDLKEILLKINKEIYDLNISLGKLYKDPLNYDLAETVGIGAIIVNNSLFYGGVEDCYVNVLRGRDLENVALWNYQILKAGKYIDRLSKENKLIDYVPKQLRKKLKKENFWEPCWCNYLRNNIDALDDGGELVGWGCFTGEKNLEPFIQVHEVQLRKGDHILLFSDGMIPVLEDRNFVKWFLEKNNTSFYFQLEMRQKIMKLLEGKSSKDKEKTLIYYKY